MTHVRTSPYYPQSNGKIERWHKSLKGECIRPGTPLSLEDARRLVEGYVEHYNNVRLNSAIGYITPKDMLAGRQQEIHAERDRKLEAARDSGRFVASRPRDRRNGLLLGGRPFVQSHQVRFKCCGVRLSLAFRSENGEEMAIYISEVGDPVSWRDLVRFRGEGDSLGISGPGGLLLTASTWKTTSVAPVTLGAA